MKTRTVIILALIGTCLFGCSKKDTQTVIEDQFYLTRAGADIPVWVHGNNQANVFIVTMHGGPILGNGLDFRRGKYTEALEEKYAMVYWDQRHSGAAHGNFSKDDLTLENYINDLDFLMNTLKSKYGNNISIFLMGHSWGGMATAFYLSTDNFQDKVKGWINIAGVVDLETQHIDVANRLNLFANENIAAGQSVEEWTSIQEDLQKVDLSILPVHEDDRKIIYAAEKRASELLLKEQNEEQYREGFFSNTFLGPSASLTHVSNVLFGFFSLDEEIKKHDLQAQLSVIKVPSLLIFGKYDLGTSPDVGADFYNEISSTEKELSIYAYSSHEPMLTEPEKFNSELINFVELHK